MSSALSRTRRLAAAVLLSLALAACSDDEGSGGAASPTTAATTATTAAAPGSSTSALPAGTRNCRTIPFTPNSEDAASSVTATGVSCEEAEAFVRVAGRRTTSGGPSSVNVDGYRCVLTRSVQDPLPQAFFECTDGSKKVTFVRS
ncbi:MAG: hypothetical protein ACLGI2_05405 [Acidimicrobiia bacterium]